MVFRFSAVDEVGIGRLIVQNRILRFLVVGSISTAFSYAVYAAMLLVGMHYAAATFVSLVAGVLFSFKTQGRYVFDNADNSLIWRFTGCWLLIYPLNVLFIKALMRVGFNAYMAGLLPVPLIAIVSYIMQRYVVFGVGTARAQSVRGRPTE